LFKLINMISVALVLGVSHVALGADVAAGEARYNQSCNNCHGPAGKGVSSYPKVSGKDFAYTKEKLIAYRNGVKQGPNSALMIMMAKPLTDQEIDNLSAYLENAEYKN
jgi:cytochrome c553